MMRNLLATLAALALGAQSSTAASATPLYERALEQWGDDAALVTSREFKFLVDPSKLPDREKDAFKVLWADTKAALAKSGYTLLDRDEKQWKVRHAIKTFWDTPEMTLWKHGWLIRVSESLNGKDTRSDKVVIKRINTPDEQILALARQQKRANAAQRTLEDNVGIGPNGAPVSYLELTLTWKASHALDAQQLWAEVLDKIPELRSLEISGAALQPHAAYAKSVTPGSLRLAGRNENAPLTIESWSSAPDAKPYVMDFSWGYGGDFSAMRATHRESAGALEALHRELSETLEFPQAGHFMGSKARVLLKMPVTE